MCCFSFFVFYFSNGSSILFENSTWLLDRLCHFKCLIRKHMCDGIVTLWECSLYDFLKTLFRKYKMVASTGKSFNIRLYRNMNGFSQNQKCTGSWSWLWSYGSWVGLPMESVVSSNPAQARWNRYNIKIIW